MSLNVDVCFSDGTGSGPALHDPAPSPGQDHQHCPSIALQGIVPIPQSTLLAYNTSKAAAINLTRALAG